jgi:hypothetical protein
VCAASGARKSITLELGTLNWRNQAIAQVYAFHSPRVDECNGDFSPTNHAPLLDAVTEGTGAFVCHCHILDHENGWMMAKIQVNPAKRTSDPTLSQLDQLGTFPVRAQALFFAVMAENADQHCSTSLLPQ